MLTEFDTSDKNFDINQHYAVSVRFEGFSTLDLGLTCVSGFPCPVQGLRGVGGSSFRPNSIRVWFSLLSRKHNHEP